MRQMVEKILNYYGQEMTIVRDGESCTVRGFFQSVTGKAEQMARKSPTCLGQASSGRYTYIGPVEPALMEGDTLVVGEQRYTVRRAETVWGNQETAYVWGMCVKKGGEDAWGANG